MKRHIWGPEIKYGTGHVRRKCQRKGCRWAMDVSTQGKGPEKRTAISYIKAVSDNVWQDRLVTELPDCVGE